MPSLRPHRPSRPSQKPLKLLRDCIRPGVRVLFVGINPGLRSAEIGHHFAGYSNRFWKLLYESGLVPERNTCEDDRRLPEWGFGLTNIVPRATSGIDELTREEYRAGARRLIQKIRRLKPEVVALVGVTVWRALLEALGENEIRSRPVTMGFQPLTIEGARVAVLPNPSGRNATIPYEGMVEAFRVLSPWAGQAQAAGPGDAMHESAPPSARTARTRAQSVRAHTRKSSRRKSRS